MKSIIIALVILVYTGLFLTHLPRIDYVASGYGASCIGNTGAFKEIPGTSVEVKGKNDYSFTDPTWDVVAKVICGQGTPEDPQALISQIRANPTDPDVVTVRNQKANYTVQIVRSVYQPSFWGYVGRLGGLIALVGIVALI